MLINATKSRLVIGRFSILPGEKVPAFQLTGEEAAAVDKFKSSGRLVEKPGNNMDVEAPVVEKPNPKSTGRSRKPVAQTVENRQADQDAPESSGADSAHPAEQGAGPEGE